MLIGICSVGFNSQKEMVTFVIGQEKERSKSRRHSMRMMDAAAKGTCLYLGVLVVFANDQADGHGGFRI